MMIDRKIQEYAKDKSVLILSDNGTDRVSWKKFFKDLGFNLNNIVAYEQWDEVQTKIKTQTFNIIISTYYFKENNTEDIFNSFFERNNRLMNRISVLVADDDDQTSHSFALSRKVDVLLVKPYTLSDLQSAIKEVLVNRVNADKKLKMMSKFEEYLTEDKFDEAREVVEKMREEFDSDPQIPICIAELAEAEGNTNDAIEFFKIAFDLNKESYIALRGIFRNAYQVQNFGDCVLALEHITEFHPISDEYLQDYLKAAISQKKHDLVIRVCYKVSNGYKSLNKKLYSIFSAALTLSGEGLGLAGEKDRGKVAIQKAIKFSRKEAPLIFHKALRALIKIGESQLAYDTIQDLEDEEVTNDVKVIEYMAIKDLYDVGHIVQKGMELIRDGVVTDEIYDIIIPAAVKADMRQERIEDLIFEAGKHNPEKKSYFDQTYLKAS